MCIIVLFSQIISYFLIYYFFFYHRIFINIVYFWLIKVNHILMLSENDFVCLQRSFGWSARWYCYCLSTVGAVVHCQQMWIWKDMHSSCTVIWPKCTELPKTSAFHFSDSCGPGNSRRLVNFMRLLCSINIMWILSIMNHFNNLTVNYVYVFSPNFWSPIKLLILLTCWVFW